MTAFTFINAGLNSREEAIELLENGEVLYTRDDGLFELFYNDDSGGIYYRRRGRSQTGNLVIGIWGGYEEFSKKVPWYEAIPEDGVFCWVVSGGERFVYLVSAKLDDGYWSLDGEAEWVDEEPVPLTVSEVRTRTFNNLHF